MIFFSLGLSLDRPFLYLNKRKNAPIKLDWGAHFPKTILKEISLLYLYPSSLCVQATER
ncbi:hypothetical protein JCM19232_5974 [Vibrio ishigakensis]|uniref:Uncharacterized protein n=1 Tax=Vibrio ishigakensis TaxID=1481914 RepID=A0A0B8PEW2_9VIBR|nr:hypothetical protein JCM19232_5974 [Vibrio ishigakensis]